jgi:hypothetical protein
VPPLNRRNRAERLASWNAAGRAGRAFGPTRASGKRARFLWIAAVVASDLSATTRLVAHTLVTHGKTTGADIFPGTRTLARESALSERAVCTHLDVLVRRGFLGRQSRQGETAGTRGFEYLLFIPRVLKDVQHSAERGADGAEGRSGAVLKDVQRSYPSSHPKRNTGDFSNDATNTV